MCRWGGRRCKKRVKNQESTDKKGKICKCAVPIAIGNRCTDGMKGIIEARRHIQKKGSVYSLLGEGREGFCRPALRIDPSLPLHLSVLMVQ
jgi:hypothetical protein